MVKYVLIFKTVDDIKWSVQIETDSYSGQPINIFGVSEQAAILSYEGDTDDPFSVFIKSTLKINCYNEGQIDINELQSAQDKDFIVKLYRGAVINWIGYLDPSGISAPMKSTPYSISLNAIDGISLLADIDYTHNNLPGTTAIPTRCPMNFIRQILFSTKNLGIMIPIRWTNSLECTFYGGEDVFTGSVSWSPHGEGFTSYTEPDGTTAKTKKCDFILQGILQSMQCRIYQAFGRWNIRRIPEMSLPSITYNQIAGNLDIMVLQSGIENITHKIGRSEYTFINEDQILTNKQGVKSAKVTYDSIVRTNIVPNGSQDVSNFGSPLYWGSYDVDLSCESVDPIDGRKGMATKLSQVIPAFEFDKFTLVSPGSTITNNGIPIDTNTLIKKVSFGFTFLPQGFPADGITDIISWLNEPLRIQLVFNSGSSQYFLNEFGFWVLGETFISITVDQMKNGDVATVNFDRFQGIIMPTPISQPIAGDTCDIQLIFVLYPDTQLTLDNIYLTIEDSKDVYESSLPESKNTGVDERTLNISSSFGGYMLSNFMTEWYNSDKECFFQDGIYYTGTLTGMTANVIMRFRYKSSKIYNGSMNVRSKNWSFDQIYLIDGQGSSRFLPLNSDYNIEKCEVSVVAIECRNDNVIFTEKFFGSNDQQLSN